MEGTAFFGGGSLVMLANDTFHRRFRLNDDLQVEQKNISSSKLGTYFEAV